MEEEWRDIEGYNGLYIVSNMGRVKSLNYGRTGKCNILKQYKDEKGYLRVGLSKNSKYKMFFVHRLVASAFLPNPENKPFIDHLNTITDDNRAINLKWCTQKENINNPISISKHYGANNHKARKVLQFTREGVFVREWSCIMDVQRELGFNYSHISACCSGKRKTANNYKWKYA